MLLNILGWGGGEVNVPCTSRHVGCYARCWVGVGGMLTFLALAHMLDATQDAGAILMISCPRPSIISPKQPDWSMIRSGTICTVGNGDKMRARTCGPTCTKCLLSEKKTPLIRYSNSSAPLTRTPPCLCTCLFPPLLREDVQFKELLFVCVFKLGFNYQQDLYRL